MVKTWSPDNPKAALMARKRAAIVAAARDAFLLTGYGGASVNRIADDAGVSIKTLYRHFESKDELFAAVMRAACDMSSGADVTQPPRWYGLHPTKGLVEAGKEHLGHLVSSDHLALYRVVVRDVSRDPELGQVYLAESNARRDATLDGYLELWSDRCGWNAVDSHLAAETFAGMLKAGVFEPAVLGLHVPTVSEIGRHAEHSAACLVRLLDSGSLSRPG